MLDTQRWKSCSISGLSVNMTVAHVMVDAFTSLEMVTNIGFRHDFALPANGMIQKRAVCAHLLHCHDVVKCLVSRKQLFQGECVFYLFIVLF